jgi:hypothetical protein
MIGWNDA